MTRKSQEYGDSVSILNRASHQLVGGPRIDYLFERVPVQRPFPVATQIGARYDIIDFLWDMGQKAYSEWLPLKILGNAMNAGYLPKYANCL